MGGPNSELEKRDAGRIGGGQHGAPAKGGSLGEEANSSVHWDFAMVSTEWTLLNSIEVAGGVAHLRATWGAIFVRSPAVREPGVLSRRAGARLLLRVVRSRSAGAQGGACVKRRIATVAQRLPHDKLTDDECLVSG